MKVYGNIRLIGNSKFSQPTNPVDDIDVVTKEYYYDHLPKDNFYSVISEETNILSKTITLETVGIIRVIGDDGYEAICDKTYSNDGLTVTLNFNDLFTGQILFVENGQILGTIETGTTSVTFDLPSLGIVDVLDNTFESIICSKNYIYDGVSGYSVTLGFTPSINGGTVIFNGKDSFIVDITNEISKTIQIPGTGIVTVLDNSNNEVFVNKAYSFDGDSNIIRIEFDELFTGKAIFVSTDNSFDIINILYDDFISVINNSRLRPGKHYKITNYRTIDSISDSGSTYEPLIVLALTNNIISKRAYSQINPADLINYEYSMNITDDLISRPGYITSRTNISDIDKSIYNESIARISGDTYLQQQMNSYIPLDGSSGITGSLVPSVPGLTLGTPDNPWGEIYVTGSTIYIDNVPIRSVNNSIFMESLTINDGFIGGVNISYDENQLLYKKVDAIYNKLYFPNIISGGTLTERNWKHIASDGDILVCITSDGDVIHSFDGGYNWSEDKILINTWRGVQHETEGSSVYTQVPINVTSTGIVSKIEILNFSLSDYWIGDSDCKLVSPTGREVVLFGGVGGGSHYITNANFSDDATSYIMSSTSPYTGTFKASGDLSDFIGDSVQGDWTIFFRDPAYDGAAEYWYQGLTSWDIKIYYKPILDLTTDQILYNNLTFGNGLFVAVGNSGKTMYSNNSGISWTENIISYNDNLFNFTDIIYGNGLFVSTLSNNIISGDTIGCIATSIDCINWNICQINNVNDGLYSISYSDGQYNAISNKYFISSIDGINWTEPLDLLFDGANKIASGKNLIIVISSTGNTIAISNDKGLSFEIENSGSYIHGNICFGDNRFLIASEDAISGYSIIDSLDGKNYTSLGVLDKPYQDIIYNGKNFIAITNESYSLIIPEMTPNRIIDLENEVKDRFKNEYRVKLCTTSNINGYNNNIISNDWGWNQSIKNFTDNIIQYQIFGDTIYASSQFKILKSIDGGVTFNELSINFPNNSYIISIKFLNVNFGIIIGPNYTSLKTVDGGENWTVVTTSQSAPLTKALGIVNENHWIVLSDNYGGYVTFDGGETLEYTNGVYQFPWSIYMVNSGVGYSCYQEGRFYKTIDGGRNWSHISFLPGNQQTMSQYWFSETEGLAGMLNTGKICRTYNGGTTWLTSNVNFKTVSERVIIISFYGNTGYAFGLNGSISKSIDRGVTWKYQDSIEGGNIDAAFCSPNIIDENNIMIFQRSINRLLTTTTGGYDIKKDLDDIYPTVNDKILVNKQINKKENGVYIVKSSQPLLLERCDELYDGKFLFIGEGTKNAGCGFIQTTNDNIVLGTSNIIFKQFANQNCVDIENKSYNVLYTNTNSFITNISCYKQDNDNILLYNDTLTEIANDNFGVYFLNETTGFSYYLGNIKKTIDGGETWNTVLNDTGINLFHMQFVNNNVGYIVSHSAGRVYKTINGGDNWALCTSPPSVGSLFCLKFLDENIGFVAGSSRIYKTVDGGLNWTTVNTFSNNIWAIDFVDSNIGFAAGDNNMLFKTTNGGDTWTSHINTMTTGTVTRGMQFIGNVGYICKSDGNIYKTIDSGENWVLKTSTTKNVLLHIQFLNENLGYCVGENDTFYKTIDGGDTWIQRKDDFPGHPLRISIVNENLTYISSYSQNRIYRMVSDDSIERNFGIENIEINDIVLLNKSSSNINGIFCVNEKNDVFVGLERFCVLNTNDLCNISKGYMSGNTYVYTGNNNYAHYKSDELINISGHTNDTSIHFTKNSINLSDLGNSAHTHSNTLIDINGVTGITLTLPKSYSIVEVIDENGYVISCDKHYNNNGTTIDLVFISTFTGKAICN